MLMAYWKLILLTLAITELLKDDIVKSRKALPWLAIIIAIAVSFVYSGFSSEHIWSPLFRGLSAGVMATGMYMLAKDYIRAILRRK